MWRCSCRASSTASPTSPPDNGPDTALTGEGNSLAWRFSYWTEVVYLAADNPVTGIGLRVTEEVSGGDKQPHNDFVRAYVELGAHRADGLHPAR